MGSQTLDILRQGVWASLTGGWFYDPHLDVFCNTFHLYIWLFLLCLPFSIYVYFPPSKFVWYFYCTCVMVVITSIKVINYALHHMYDTTECIQEELEEEWQSKAREEGIELVVLPNKADGDDKTIKQESSLNFEAGNDVAHCTDIDSTESIEGVEVAVVEKKTPTIDLKAEVHRKNSSESSEDQILLPSDQATCKVLNEKSNKVKLKERKRHQKLNTDAIDVVKTDVAEQVDLENREGVIQILEQPQAGCSGNLKNRKQTSFANSSLGLHPISVENNYWKVLATGSVELGYMDNNSNQTSAEYYYNPLNKTGVRRIRSTALETSCPAPSLSIHPNSLEIIGCKSKNPLPPPSSSLIRNQHLNLCPYYGSEIVYPIAEQSDEHQTSHGPDTDLEIDSDLGAPNSDSDDSTRDRFLYVKLKKFKKNVPYCAKTDAKNDEEKISTTSKDALLDNDSIMRMQNAEISFSGEYAEEKKDELNLSASTHSLNSLEKHSVPEKKVTRKNAIRNKSRHKLRHNSEESDCDQSRHDNSNDKDVVFLNFDSDIVNDNSEKKDRSKNNSPVVFKYDLSWLFKSEEEKEVQNKESDWASSSTISLEQDVSKVLQETVSPSRNLGAIPKSSRSTKKVQDSKKTPKSESEKCTRCKSKGNISPIELIPHEKSVKIDGKLSSNMDSLVEGMECIIFPSELGTLNFLPRINQRITKIPYMEPSSNNSKINEMSNLLPPAPLLSAFVATRKDFPVAAICLPGEPAKTSNITPKKRRLSKRPRNRRNMALANSLSSGQGTHCAKNFSDTSEGALHCFRDENGKWVTYTFMENCSDAIQLVNDSQENRYNYQFAKKDSVNSRTKKYSDVWESNSLESVATSSVSAIHEVSNSITMDAEEIPTNPRAHIIVPNSVRRRIFSEMNENPTDRVVRCSGIVPTRTTFKAIKEENRPKLRTYYKFKVFPFTYIQVTLDRLKLLAMLDRNLTKWETLVSILLSVSVSILGAILLHLNFYQDFGAFVFCFVMASCQYSLLKSVQPDAASPMHGFNRIIAYSRPIYFTILCSCTLILHYLTNEHVERDIYKLDKNIFSSKYTLYYVKNFFPNLILFFPLLFSLGLFPQINTFILYLFEQIDMHIFGGNAMSSLIASVYCIFRSLLAVIILIGPAYGGLIEKKSSQHLSFSIFCACIVSCSYHLSRSASDPLHIWNIAKKHFWPPDIYKEAEKKLRSDSEKDDGIKKDSSPQETSKLKEKSQPPTEEHMDPLPKKLQMTVNARLKNDIIICGLIATLIFGIHSTTVFTVLQPELSPILWSIAAGMGFILHYMIPQMRKQLPWTCIAKPILKSFEYNYFQVKGPSKIMWFEKIYVYFCFFERNIIYPLLFVSVLTEDSPKIAESKGPLLGSFIVVICGLKCLRNSYSNQNVQYIILIFAVLSFKFDYQNILDTYLVSHFVISIAFEKVYEFLLKIQFVVTYIAPWQITWGSAFHAFAQPFSVPHSAMLFVQAIISAILSTPLNPFLGSAIFLMSYVRPIKFWEKDYNTKRVDHSNTPLSSHLDRNLGSDDNNLNSLFYEHLTRSLQHSLCGDLIMGRWGLVKQGDCFVLASDYLNCLIHIIEMGNGLVTFQMRGLEFRGTYCQQREVEAITEGVEDNDGCCCYDIGRLPNMLSINTAFSQRWLAWEVTAAKYVLEGYSISDNSAVSMFQVFEFRRLLVSYYVKSIIFYTLNSPKLKEWLSCPIILNALQPMQEKSFVDLDPVFNYNIDEDFDLHCSGMTKSNFYQIHGEWIAFCVEKCEQNIDSSANSILSVFCFALSLLARRTLGAVSHNTVSSVEFFLYGLHALFKGDFRITSSRDEWVFTDMDILKTVVQPGVRMSLKLHQDHFMSPDEYEDLNSLYTAISKHRQELVISHEGDPAWRSAVLSGTPSLLALRHVMDDGSDEYKVIMLNKRFLSFRVIKVNKECVRGLWAGQQQELVYLRNRNPERGSIQNAKQALRNIINSSCDQPIGYPIYVSPLTTSYADTNDQYCSIVGGSITITKIQDYVFNLFRRIRKRCGEGCSSGASAREDLGLGHEGIYAMTPVTTLGHHNNGSQSTEGFQLGGSIGRGSSLGRSSLGGNRGSLASVGKPTSSTLASLAGLFREKEEKSLNQTLELQQKYEDDAELPEKDALKKVVINDPNFVYDGINLGRRIDVCWPTEYMRIRGGRSYWNNWVPETGMEGFVVHKWTPGHRDISRRSHVDRTILLVQIDDKFIPIAEQGVQEVKTDL